MTTNLEQSVNQIVEREIKEGGFKGKYNIRTHEKHPRFDGCIDTTTLSEIQLGYNPSYEKDNPGNTIVVMRDLTRHEENHRARTGYHGCPRNLNLHTKKIIEPIAEVLLEKGYTQSDFHYLANAEEDTILHVDLNKGCSLDGIVLAYEDIGKHAKEKSYTEFMEAHLKLNLVLWGNKRQKKKLKPYFTRDPEKREKITKVLQNFLKRTGLADMKRENGRMAVRDYLNNEENWLEISRIYAEEFSELMTPGYAMPLFNHSGKGTKGNPEEADSQDGNIFDREMQQKNFKKRRIVEALEKDEGIPDWMDKYEALDLLYQSFAERIEINVKSFTKSSQSPSFHYGSRSFDPDRDNTRHLKFGLNEKGKVELKKKRFYEKEPLEEKIEPRGFPEARFFLVDVSASMMEDPEGGNNVGSKKVIPWGVNSKYHYATITWYSLLRYLEENGLLKQTGISRGSFSDNTSIAYGLEESKRQALNPKFGYSTVIDLNELKEIFSGEGMLLSTISDGEVHNWKTKQGIKKLFIEGADRHHYFHAQIGNPTQMSRDLEAAGKTVVYAKSAKDLAQMHIDVVDSIYRGRK